MKYHPFPKHRLQECPVFGLIATKKASFISLLGKSQELRIQLRTTIISFVSIVPKITDSLTLTYEVSLKKI